MLRGLEGIQVKEGSIGFIDLNNGRIYYRDYDLAGLANMTSFKEMTYLLRGKGAKCRKD